MHASLFAFDFPSIDFIEADRKSRLIVGSNTVCSEM